MILGEVTIELVQGISNSTVCKVYLIKCLQIPELLEEIALEPGIAYYDPQAEKCISQIIEKCHLSTVASLIHTARKSYICQSCESFQGSTRVTPGQVDLNNISN